MEELRGTGTTPEVDADGATSRRQLGLLWGGVAVAMVLLSPLAPQLAGLLPPCPLKSFTGLPCPGCGTTRAALALGRFDLVGAFAVSPLAAAGWIALVGGGLVAGLVSLAGRPLPRLLAGEGAGRPGTWTDRAWRIGVGMLLLANWLYLVYSGV